MQRALGQRTWQSASPSLRRCWAFPRSSHQTRAGKTRTRAASQTSSQTSSHVSTMCCRLRIGPSSRAGLAPATRSPSKAPGQPALASLRLAPRRCGRGCGHRGALRELSEDELKQALRSVAKSVPQVQVVNDLAIPSEEGTAEEKLSRLIAFLREPQRQPAAADGRWSARIVASPRGCPSVDYVVHLQATGSIRHDRYIAVQVKSAIGTATTSTEEISERLRRTLDRAARNLAEKDFQFDAFVLHTADDVDIVPDKQAPWFEKLPAWVVSGKAFARHFPPSVLALMSLVAADE